MKDVARLASLLALAFSSGCWDSGSGSGSNDDGNGFDTPLLWIDSGPGAGPGGSPEFAGNWDIVSWDNDGTHTGVFVVSSSGTITSGTLIHPGGITDQIVGGSMSSGSPLPLSVGVQMTFNGQYFRTVSFTLENGGYVLGPSQLTVMGDLNPTVPLDPALYPVMGGGGPAEFRRR